MADQQSNETIRQMMSGFSAMQYNLGLLPMPQAQAMAGAGAQYQAPPPPPQVPHPSEAAMQAMATHQNMIQQTMQAAQMTRYTPPPSAPIGAMSMYGGGGYISPLGGGGGGFGGGGPSPFAGGGGGFGGNHTAPFAPRMPSIFNPFAPTLPTAHFATPAMRNQQLMQHAQAQTMGLISGVGDAAMGIGGSVLGGMAGGMFGTFGKLAGGVIGSAIGGAVSSMIFNPVTQDYARGRQIQQMTAPFMVSGPNMNMATGAGLDARAGREVASGIRHLARDHDFERTGFNSQDAMRIMQTSASAGLLTGATSPDQLVQKVKDISKTVKVLMKITGDPDVRDAIHSLGQMRDMGFQGLASQAGAVANRMAFARMAGQSPAQMMQAMQMGGDMAGQYGLVGATGAMAGGFGAGAANVAASSGALNDMQLARAGGRSGLGQTLAQGSLSAMNNDQYMLAAMGRDSKGRMTVDMNAFRRAQTMSFGEVQEKAADALRTMDTKGVFEWNTRRQEFKDQIAQKLHPGEMQMMMIQQAKAFQNAVPGMSLGTAIEKTTGMGADQARSLELMANSRQYWQGLANQARIDRRDLMDQEKAQREEYRTPGLATRMRRGIGDAMGSVSDTLSSPFRRIAGHFERMREENEAADHGERISRYGDSDIAHDAGERKMLRDSLRRGGSMRGGANFVDQMGTGGMTGALGRSAGRQMNRIGSFLGLSGESDANRLASIADYSKGRYTSLGESFGDPRDALARVQDVIQVGQAASASPLAGDKLTKLYQSIGDAKGTSGHKVSAAAVMASTTLNVMDRIKDKKAGYIKSAGAMAGSDFRAAFMEAAKQNGMNEGEAAKAWDANKSQIINSIAEDVHNSGDKKAIETIEKAKEVQFRAGAVDLARTDDEAKDAISAKLKKSGMGDLSDKGMQQIKSVLANHDMDTIAIASAQAALTSGNDEEKKVAQKVLAEQQAKLGDKVFGEKLREAKNLQGSMSGDVQDAFERTLRGSANVQDVKDKLSLVSEAAGDKMKLAAQKEFKQKLDRAHKGAAGADSVMDAVHMISDAELDQLDKPTREAIQKFRKTGDAGAIDDAVAAAGPSTRTTRHSDATSDKLNELEERAAALDQMAAGASDEGAGGDVQLKATTLFADAVSNFATAVKDLKGDSENDRLNKLNPFNLARGGDN